MLAVLGLTGTLLLHKESWLRWTLPMPATRRYRTAPRSRRPLHGFSDWSERPSSILFAIEGSASTASLMKASTVLMPSRPARSSPAGARSGSGGGLAVRRPPLSADGRDWVAIAGTVGLIGLCFVITGAILWWRDRSLAARRRTIQKRDLRQRSLPSRGVSDRELRSATSLRGSLPLIMSNICLSGLISSWEREAQLREAPRPTFLPGPDVRQA